MSHSSDRTPAIHPHRPSPDLRVRRLFLHALAAIFLIAFASLGSQILGLVGSEGILPAASYLERAREQVGTDAYRRLPTLCWLDASDRTLTGLCVLGVCQASLLMFGIAPRLVLVGLWGTYLSLCVAGQAFLSFQWDTLLLETTLCAILYAPRGWWPDPREPSPPLPLARWLLWGLAFKLMFLSGVTKLLSADPVWGDWTALNYHYFTQPIPSWTSWFAHHLPETVHKACVAVMFVIEVLLPFLIFCGRRGRAVFAMATILLMAAIQATGNFGFFNLLTAVLCLPLLDDDLLRRLNPWGRAAPPATVPDSAGRSLPRMIVGNLIAVAILLASLLTLFREMVRTQHYEKMPMPVVRALGLAERGLLRWGEPWILDRIAPFRSINGYGLFRVMTTQRPEIVIEYSYDGVTWKEYEFPYKPGRIDRAPPIVAPHMPRLDWQMWFAALNPRGNGYWLSSLLERILEGNPTTAELLGRPDIAERPPRYVRLASHFYEFSSPDGKRETGAWWVRSRQGELTAALQRRD